MRPPTSDLGMRSAERTFEPETPFVDNLQVGMRVRHPEWGLGTIKERIGEGEPRTQHAGDSQEARTERRWDERTERHADRSRPPRGLRENRHRLSGFPRTDQPGATAEGARCTVRAS